MPSKDAAIPKGSWVLVTGATGYIASHIILKLLEHGYKVRGTVRDLKKSAWLTDELFPSYASSGAFELAEVPDLATPGAFDEAVKGTSGVIHVATIATWSPNPYEVIPQTVQGALNALESAAKEPEVKRFVYTSSVVAATMLSPNVKFHVDSNSWNEDAASIAWAPPPYNPDRSIAVYVQSKVEAEKAVWKFVTDRKPSFAVNTVLPTTVLGEVLNPRQWTTTPSWIKQVWNGQLDVAQQLPAGNYVHVRDVATVHVGALLDPDVNNQRLPAWNQGFNWNDILAIFRKLRPNRTFVDDLENSASFLATVDDAQSLKLLKTWNDQSGWTSLETGIKEMVAQLE